MPRTILIPINNLRSDRESVLPRNVILQRARGEVKVEEVKSKCQGLPLK